MRYGINLPNGGLTGKHYQIKEIALLPQPVQRPRIPIWIGGGFPLKGATQRALQWDGSCMYIDTRGGPWRDWAPKDVRTLRTMAERWRGTDAPFDIVLGGRQRDADWEREEAFVHHPSSTTGRSDSAIGPSGCAFPHE